MPKQTTIRDTSNPLIKNATDCLFLATHVGSGSLGDVKVEISSDVGGSMIIRFDDAGVCAQYIVPVSDVILAAYERMKAGE